MTDLNAMYSFQSHTLIAVDYDGTIIEDVPFPQAGNLKAEAKKYLDLLNERGFTIVLWTARLYDGYVNVLKRCKEEFNMPYILEDSPKFLHGASGKIVAAYYIDDKSVTEGLNWEKIYNYIIEKYSKYVDLK